jgi:hypothetical protein
MLDTCNHDDRSIIRFKVYHHFSIDNSEQILRRITLFEQDRVGHEFTRDEKGLKQLKLFGRKIPK